jgi:hypothetical protein
VKNLCLAALLVLLVACAKRLPPPNPDRFAPSFQGLNVVNQNRLDLVFDEPMSQKDMSLADFAIVTANGDTLGLLAAAFSPDGATISLLTRRQRSEKYTLTGSALDVAGNGTRFQRRFVGSSRPDTVAPMITGIAPRNYATRVRKGVIVSFSFSKATDTMTYGGVIVLPAGLESRFDRKWSTGLDNLQFTLKDSLGPDTTVSFILLPMVRDFAGNHLRQAAYTSFTSDSLLLPRLVKGKLTFEGKPPVNGYVVLGQDAPVAATPVRSDGSFTLRARPVDYSVLAAADTNYDGYVDLSARIGRATLPESLAVTLQPETLRVRLDSIGRNR